jgi:hypothetical protein
MKKSVNIAGIIFLLILLTAIVFKRLHYPGAGIMLTLSLFLFITVYLPSFFMSLYRQMKEEGKASGKWTVFLGAPGITVLTFGILSKIMHWPGAAIALWLGAAITAVAVLLFMISNRRSEAKIPMISVLIVIIVLGFFSFNMFRFGNMRPMNDAYKLCGNAAMESSVLLSTSCQSILEHTVPSGSDTAFTAKLKEIHFLTEKADGLLKDMSDRIAKAEEKSSGLKPKNKEEFMQNEISMILSSENGFSAFDRLLVEIKARVAAIEFPNQDLKEKVTGKLACPYTQNEPIPAFGYLGIYSFSADKCINSIYLWRTRIWEAEYTVLTGSLSK